LLDDPGADVRNQALRALMLWASKDSLPDLVEYARREQTAPGGSPLLLDVLAQFPDPAAADAIALQLSNVHTRDQAGRALLKLGPAAVNTVLRHMDDPNECARTETRKLADLLNISADRLLQQAVADVSTSDIPRSVAALQYLAGSRLNEAYREQVSQALNGALLDPNDAIRENALDALRVWSSKENTPALLAILGNHGEANERRVTALLGRLQDPAAARVLAQGLMFDDQRIATIRALEAIGPAAEDAVIPCLESQEREVRFAAVGILGDIGTGKSIQPLQTALDTFRATDFEYYQEASIALEMINARH
jgi:HEAT repeat protein